MSTPTTELVVATPAGGGQPPAGPAVLAWVRAATRDLAYSAAILVWSVVAFSVLVTGLAVTASLLAFVMGVVVWVGFVFVVRWTSWVDRRLAGWQRRSPVRATYRHCDQPGFLPMVRTLTRDPQTWRDLAWLVVTSVTGFALGLTVVTAVGAVGTYLSMPLWYWAIGDPQTQYGLTNIGVFTVDSLARAALVALVALFLVPAVLLLARGCAALHARLAVRLLGSS